MIRFVSTSDTDILAVAGALERLPAGFPEVRCLNPLDAGSPKEAVDDLLTGAQVVVVRLLGGRRAWEEGFDLMRERCAREGIAFLAFSGEAEPDVQLGALSLAPAGALAQAGEYLRHGDIGNMEQLLRFLADTFLLEGYGFEPPRAVPDYGFYLPGVGDVAPEQAFARLDPKRPTVGICFYRAHRLAGNTAFVDALFGAVEEAGGNGLALWSYTLRAHSHPPAKEALDLLKDRVDCLLLTVQAAGGAPQESPLAGWSAPHLEGLGVPIVQGICVTRPRADWAASTVGLEPFDAATQVAIPEFEGRIIGGVVSFKERTAEGSPVGAPLARYVPDPERAAAVARLAVRHGRLRKVPPNRKRVAVILTNFPNNEGRLGMAVGLDTPTSTLRLLERLAEEGIELELPFANGEELIAELVARYAHNPDLAGTAGDLPIYPLDRYLQRYRSLPEPLRAEVEGRFGAPPGEFAVVDGGFAIGALELGNVVLALQPLRALGDDPVAIYHDPTLPPSHHYIATYWWLEECFKADLVVHLGKHGTLEWLPGKTVALSAACAPDAVLGQLPFIYPFLVNDPGEGIQAKRRTHAVIVDHLLPVQAQAETYGHLQALEELLDEYARLELIDPGKLPNLASRIWQEVQAAKLDRDLGLAQMPAQAEELLERLDAYLCEVKEAQVGEGLHVLGEPPEGERLRHLLGRILANPGPRYTPLRSAVAAAFGLSEELLLERPGARLSDLGLTVPQRLGPLVGGNRASDLLAALDTICNQLLAQLEEEGYERKAVGAVCKAVLGTVTDQLEAVLGLACEEVVPRIKGCAAELEAVVAAINGCHVPGGPSGSPTRGRLEVLPTGRNFYSLDPRAMPSELAYEAGARLAKELLDRYRADHGTLPRMVGLVLWGSAAIRTQGEDFSQALALLGVRPRFEPASRRIVGVEPIPLAELGRPRIDLTVRVSGFFRDAFPHLLDLLDEAVQLVAGLEEPPELNFVRGHVAQDGGVADPSRFRAATIRIFSSKPGTYGAGIAELLDAAEWRSQEDLAEAYERYGSYAYGKGLAGEPAREALAGCLRRIEAAVQNRDNEEHDILNSGDYLQFHGGMVAAVALRRGQAPAAYIGDSSRPGRPKVRTLEEEVRRVFRARVTNPRWIASMVRHGYKGAAELAATVDYLFGYDATAGAAEGWMYEEVANRYLLDEDVAAFFRKANPWAARGIAQRLLEAHRRGLWEDAPEGLVGQLEEALLSFEGEAEGVGGGR
jgi:cobaltochelatase CobN